MRPARLFLPAIVIAVFASPPAVAQGHRVEACSRGNVQACLALLARPRLDPGRRAAIELHLAELEALLGACLAGEAQACSTLSQDYPDMPPELRAEKVPPVPKGIE